MKSNKLTKSILGFLILAISCSISSAQSRPPLNDEQEEIFKVVEQMPRFPGCEMLKATDQIKKKCADEKLLDYIYSNQVYPKIALENGIEGTCVVRFVVEKDGTIGDVELIRDPGAGTGPEGVRLVESMNNLKEKWTPGLQRGVPRKVLYTLPIRFKLDYKHESRGDNKELQKGEKLGTINPFGKSKKVNKHKSKNRENLPPPPPPPPAPNMDKAEIFKVVEQMPRFPGCEMLGANETVVKKCAQEKMFEYIGKHLVYPQAAKDLKIQGTAVVNFIVTKKGQLNDIKVIRDVDGQFAESVTTLIESMPAWIPGKQRGQAVKVLMTLPIKFKLDKDGNEPLKKDTGTLGQRGSSDKMEKGKRMGKVSPFDKSKKVNKDEVIRADPPPPPPHKVETAETFKVVEEMPRFPGCEKMSGTGQEKKKCSDGKMLEYIYKNIKYPGEARENGIEGMAVIKFIVEKDGSIEEAEISRNPGGGIGEEALRVIKSMNNMPEKWTPGLQRGCPVRVLYTIPVKFKLEGKSNTSSKKWWQFWK